MTLPTVALAALLALLTAPASATAGSITRVYSGGPIITMDGPAPVTVEAVATRDGRILATGTRQDIARVTAGLPAHRVETIDLAGHSLLPGFIDAHGHVAAVGTLQRTVSLSPFAPAGITTIAALQAALRAATPGENGIVIGTGYDDSQLTEQRHPTRHDLDQVSATTPILLFHVSGHLAVMNTAMLHRAGIDRDTPDPAGGHIQREADGKTPNGFLEETAAMQAMRYLLTQTTADATRDLLAGLAVYVRHGITTAQEGYLASRDAALIAAARRADLPIDLGILIAGIDSWPAAITAEIGAPHRQRVRIAGLKYILDGSPQGRTAYLSEPYHHVAAGRPADDRGRATLDAATLTASFARAARHHWPVFAHANGDAASDLLIAAVASSGLGGQRTVAIHAQILRPEQLTAMHRLDIQPSFFVTHTYYWGDWHRETTLGPIRADVISPQASAWAAGLRPTMHNDAPVVAPDIIRLLWSATTRRTLSGDILGPAERIDIYRALQEVTINAAWQIREDGNKGSIAVGKQADFVILDRNPLTATADELLATQILATISRGRTIFSATDQARTAIGSTDISAHRPAAGAKGRPSRKAPARPVA